MYCPVCRDEFRPGFTRCANCDVDLVERLPSGDTAPSTTARRGAERETPAFVPMVEYCGFVALEDARDARRKLRGEGVRSEIVIRDGADAEEEYWLRVERTRYQDATRLLGYDPADASAEEETLACGECGQPVSADESFCPRCGERFESQ